MFTPTVPFFDFPRLCRILIIIINIYYDVIYDYLAYNTKHILRHRCWIW